MIARIRLSLLGVEKRMHEPFGRAADGRQAMTLRLKSGAEVALIAGWWPGPWTKDLLLHGQSTCCNRYFVHGPVR